MAQAVEDRGARAWLKKQGLGLREGFRDLRDRLLHERSVKLMAAPGVLAPALSLVVWGLEERAASASGADQGWIKSLGSADFSDFARKDLASAHQILLNIARTIALRLRKSNQDMEKLTTVLAISMRKPRR